MSTEIPRAIALRVAHRYELPGLAGVLEASRALSRAFAGGRLPLHELLEPATWPEWQARYVRSADCDPAPATWETLIDCDGGPR